MSIENEIRDLISKNFPNIDSHKISSASALETQGIDSLDLSTLLFAVEEKFDKRIPTDQVSAMQSINDIVNFIEKTNTL